MTFLILAIVFTYVNAPFAYLREEPTEASKPETQGIYSERVLVSEEKNGYYKAETPDGAVGWVQKTQIYATPEKFIENQGSVVAMVDRLAAHVYGIKDTEYGPIKTLPYESKLEVVDQFNDPKGRWLKVKMVDGTLAYIQRGDVLIDPTPIPRSEIVEFSKRFMGLPYTWGGRTSLGYDCSGFTQMLYRRMGIDIPRNSRDQAKWEGFKEIAIEALQPGDLIFFGVPGRINHVGMYIGNDEFIHATVRENKPYIHISSLKDADWNGSGSLNFRAARALQ